MKLIIVDIIGGAGTGGDTKPAKKFYARKIQDMPRDQR